MIFDSKNKWSHYYYLVGPCSQGASTAVPIGPLSAFIHMHPNLVVPFVAKPLRFLSAGTFRLQCACALPEFQLVRY